MASSVLHSDTADGLVEETSTSHLIALEDQYGAHNYKLSTSSSNAPPVSGSTMSKAAATSTSSPPTPRSIRATATLVSSPPCRSRPSASPSPRAPSATTSSLFYKELTDLTGFEMVLPMNSGTEAVESAIKLARKWGYKIKGIPEGKAEIIVCENNFHGRTISIISFSTEPQYRDGFGPYLSGFKVIPFGDAKALREAITPNTAAFLVEPIQGEAGVLIPPDGYLSEAAAICRENNVLFMADEIQSGLGRTGKLFACEHEGVTPDFLIVGKAVSPVASIPSPPCLLPGRSSVC